MVDLPAPEGPTIATVRPPGTSKLIPFRIARFWIVVEVNVLEADGRLSHDERLGVGLVDDLGGDVEQVEHRLDVDQALADFAVDEADEVERHGELHQERR